MNADAERALVGMTVGEVGLFVLVGVLLALSFGGGSFLADTSRTVCAAALAFVVVVEPLVPLWNSLDIRRRTDDPDRVWTHVPAISIINRFGLAACLADRSDD